MVTSATITEAQYWCCICMCLVDLIQAYLFIAYTNVIFMLENTTNLHINWLLVTRLKQLCSY